VQTESIESRVVPGTVLTMSRFFPRKALMRVDFPTLGFPITATFGRFGVTDPKSLGGREFEDYLIHEFLEAEPLTAETG